MTADGRRGTQGAVKGSAEQRLAELYVEHAPGIRRMSYMITGDRHEAEDLVQEAFIRLGGRLLALRDPDRAAGYLYRTVMNLGRDRGRRLHRDRELGKRLSHEAVVPPAPETGDEVWRALLSLPMRHRAVLFLRYYLDLSEAQTAEILGCSTSAVKSLNHRASQSLKKQLEGGDQ